MGFGPGVGGLTGLKTEALESCGMEINGVVEEQTPGQCRLSHSPSYEPSRGPGALGATPRYWHIQLRLPWTNPLMCSSHQEKESWTDYT
ncbi:hypothetical protein DPEC_G00134490 [Dallia pectoralis]|uniref:Uncharacterized protein n=1 Tax=Dallia pectoralis TaxID=75939 RepID=A0ACC2GS17_DALPE|nr:hypothetical protein DPEC_G00134490 [Dallia pectoralis]